MRPLEPRHQLLKIGDLDRLKRLDTFVGHLLSLSRHSLVLLPAPPTDEQCRDNRLVNWVYDDRMYSGGSPGSSSSAGAPRRLGAAADALGLRLGVERVLTGLALDGCEYHLWHVTL